MPRMLLPAALVVFVLTLATAPGRAEIRTLDGSGNNTYHPSWGRAGTPYLRVAPTNYADGIQAMVAGPPARYVTSTRPTRSSSSGTTSA